MQRSINSFRGEAPRVTPRALPDNAAQVAMNASLLTGDLRAFQQFSTTIGLANPGTVHTVFLLNGAWLSWTVQVDVARGAIAGDTTFRIFLTSPDYYATPRFTNYALATTGSVPYPVTTRPLGVPAPTSAPGLTVTVSDVPTTEVTDSGDQLTTTWVTSPTVIALATVSEVTQDAGVGNPAPSYKIRNAHNQTVGAYAYRDFGIANETAINFQCQFAPITGSFGTEATFRTMCTSAGEGAVVKVGYPAGLAGGLMLMVGNGAQWGDDTGSWLQQVAMAALDGTGATWYTTVIAMSKEPSGTYTVNAKVYHGVTLLAEAEATSSFKTGGFCGIEMVTASDEFSTHFDNFDVTGSGATQVITQIATSYVFTYVDDFSQESAPSPASVTILRPDGVQVAVTTPTDLPSGVSTDYGITTKRIYRAATGNAGTEFRFVAEIPLAQLEYDDTLLDSELGEVLPSTLWALPPDDLEGILALPNGVMAGFSKNQLCLSAQNHPHAWPVEYRLNTDSDIVGIGNVDTTVVIGTETFVYIASGNDPAAYSMSKFEVPYACSSKTSFAYLTGIGVVFAGPNGLMAVTGPGQVRNLTDTVFTREQWQALNPSSMVGVAHNDIYWLFWESGSQRGCYGIDMKPTGFGVIQMAFHSSATYVDPIHDKMYMILDEDSEPDDDMLPVRSAMPHYLDGRTLYEFGGDAAVLMTYRWRSKLWLLEHPAWMSICQVKARDGDYDNILFRLYGDGVLLDEIVIEGESEFTLSVTDDYTTLQYEFMGTSPVSIVQAAESIEELPL